MKPCLLISIVFFVSVKAFAQKKCFYIDATYAIPNISSFALKSTNLEAEQEYLSGVLKGGFFLSDKWSVGIGYSSNGAKSKTRTEYTESIFGNTIDTFSYTIDLKSKALVTFVNYNFIANTRWNVSSGLGIGFGWTSMNVAATQSSQSIPNVSAYNGLTFQIQLIECKYYLTNNLGLHVGLGFGAQSIIGVGVTGRL